MYRSLHNTWSTILETNIGKEQLTTRIKGLAAKQSSAYTSCNAKRGETLKYTAAKRKKEPYLFELCRPQSVFCHARWALENYVQWYARQHNRAILSAGQHYNSVICGKTLHARKNTQPVLSARSVQQTKQIIWVTGREIAGLRALFAKNNNNNILALSGVALRDYDKEQVSYYCY